MSHRARFLAFALWVTILSAKAQDVIDRGGCPQAGQDRALALCSFGDPLVLIPDGGDAGGSWFDPFGQPHGSSLIPSSDPSGCYSYVVYGTAPCVNDTALACVSITPAPNAGTDGTLTLCGNAAPVDLFAQLSGAYAGGSWTGPVGPCSGTYDPATDSPGVYTYTVNGIPPCPNDQATVTVTENAPPNAGISTTDTACADMGMTSMFALLMGGQGGGTWTSPTGQPHSGMFDPTTDPLGCYAYTVVGTAPCANATALVCIVALDTCSTMGIEARGSNSFTIQWCDGAAGPFVRITTPFTQQLRLSVYSASGQLVLLRQVVAASPVMQVDLDLTGEAAGIYIVLAEGPAGRACARLLR